MSTAIITQEAVVRFAFPPADECQEGDRVVILRDGDTLVAERRNGAWQEIFPPVASRRPASPDAALEAKIAQLICDFEGNDLTSFEVAREIIRMVRQDEKAKRPNTGAKYLDTATGDEYEMGQDMQWRRIKP